MASNQTLINLKARAKKLLLVFTLLISFFALSGYVSNNLPNTRTTNSGAMAVAPLTQKSGISYKRAVLAFYKSSQASLLPSDDINQRILLFNELSINRYQQLKQLYLAIKPIIHFRLIHPTYSSDNDSFDGC